ncbi:MAG: hypothetical protein ACOX17_01970 [Christensenellales bacterium]|jgi:hypothetical protein
MMLRWFKLYKNQYIGFWVLGVVLFVLQEVPYIVMPLFRLADNPIMHMQESSQILNICEKILGSLCVAVMCFVVHEKATVFSTGKGIRKAAFVSAAVILLLNFFGWGLYYSGYQAVWVMMFFMVALPPLYYAAIGVWRENPILSITAIAFEIVHVVHVYGNLTM